MGQAAEVDGAAMDRNVAFYEEHFDEYAEAFPGKHLLIAEGSFKGAFDTREDAVTAGYRLEVQAVLIRKSGTRPEAGFLPTIFGSRALQLGYHGD